MDCTNCGAPLPPKSNICTYCETLNDVDLRAIHCGRSRGDQTPRLCPRCGIHLNRIELHIEGRLEIDRCERCLGIFFDPGELEALTESSVSKAYEIDHVRLHRIIEEECIDSPHKATYVKCPDCGQLMNRKNYGSRSGVVVDQCRNHGIWLDGTELSQILKWVKAGGRIHDQQREKEEKRSQNRRDAKKKHERLVGEHQSYTRMPGAWEGIAFISIIRFLAGLWR